MPSPLLAHCIQQHTAYYDWLRSHNYVASHVSVHTKVRIIKQAVSQIESVVAWEGTNLAPEPQGTVLHTPTRD